MKIRPMTTMKSACLALLCAAALFGCTADESETEPPRHDPYFPTGLEITPSESHLFVINANSDLGYDSGTVQVWDLETLDAIVNAWLDQKEIPAGCEEELLRPGVLRCDTTDDREDVAPFVLGSSVGIGNFAVAGAVQPLSNGMTRLFVTVRGDPSVTFIDFDGTRLDCGGSGDFPRCDAAHRLDEIRDNADELGGLSIEPYSVYVDPIAELGYVTHLTSGQVTLFEAPSDGETRPRIADVLTGVWTPSGDTGEVGATGIAARLPGDPRGLVYASSRRESRIITFRAADPIDPAQPPELALGPTFFLPGAVSGGSPGDTRGLAFSPDGNLAVFVSRRPPMLYVYDTSIGETGVPRNEPVGAIELCGQPSQVALADFGEGLVAYTPCFETGRVQASHIARLERITDTDAGKGPSAIVGAPGRKRVYVANYGEDIVSVIDARPGSPTQHQVVLRAGKLREQN